jgi:hypothetical protein
MLTQPLSQFRWPTVYRSWPDKHEINPLKQMQKGDVFSGHLAINMDSFTTCKILGFHGGDYEECRLLGCGAGEILCAICSPLLTLVPRSRIFLPWRWRRYVPPKRRFIQDLHGATSQKTAFFSFTTYFSKNQVGSSFEVFRLKCRILTSPCVLQIARISSSSTILAQTTNNSLFLLLLLFLDPNIVLSSLYSKTPNLFLFCLHFRIINQRSADRCLISAFITTKRSVKLHYVT